jgi:2-dehydropantoate 2-reductase
MEIDALVTAVQEVSGFDAPIRESIRWNIWLKLWGNVCFNPIKRPDPRDPRSHHL